MKKNLILITLSILLFGCATNSYRPVDEQALRSNLAWTNFQIWGDYPENDYTDLTETFYHQQLSTYTSAPAAVELKESLKDFDILEIKTAKHSFAVCGYSQKNKIAFCDDAACNDVENFMVTPNAEIIATWKNDLPLKVCPKK